jgi:hypothetical protein
LIAVAIEKNKTHDALFKTFFFNQETLSSFGQNKKKNIEKKKRDVSLKNNNNNNNNK